MKKVLELIEDHGFDLKNCDILDMFASVDSGLPSAYYGRVRNMTAWEIRMDHIAKVEQYYPMIKTTVGNPYELIESYDGMVDILIADTYLLSCPWWEHFSLPWDAVLGRIKNPGVLVLTVAPTISWYYDSGKNKVGTRHRDIYEPTHKEKRKQFYGVLGDGEIITHDEMRAKYKSIIEGLGRKILWNEFVSRYKPDQYEWYVIGIGV